MTERVVIEGTDLNVTMQEPAEPQRKRPPKLSTEERDKRRTQELTGAVRSPSGWTIDEMIGMKNPFHQEDA